MFYISGLYYIDYNVTAVNLDYDSDLSDSTTERYIKYSADFENVVSSITESKFILVLFSPHNSK